MNRSAVTDERSRGERRGAPPPFPFARMLRRRDALDRLDLRFVWGGYGIRILRCHLVAFPPGQYIAPHKHSEFEFHFIPKGRGKVTIEERSYDLREGMFYLTGPGVVHSQEVDVGDPMHELCLHCDIAPTGRAQLADSEYGEDLEWSEAEECIEILRSFPAQPEWDAYNAMGSFLDAYRIWEEQPPGFGTQMKMAMTQILLRATRMFANRNRAPSIPVRDMNDHRFQLASQYIQDNESLPITLEDVAERVDISPRQLQRIFRTEGQTTFRDYMEHVRLSAVCADLISTDKPIEEIALLHGFATPNYLFPVFKNKFGMTPSAYRRTRSADSGASTANNATIREEVQP